MILTKVNLHLAFLLIFMTVATLSRVPEMDGGGVAMPLEVSWRGFRQS